MSEVDVIVDRCGEQIAMAAETLGASMTMARPRGRLSSDASGARIIRLFVRVDYGREVKHANVVCVVMPNGEVQILPMEGQLVLPAQPEFSAE